MSSGCSAGAPGAQAARCAACLLAVLALGAPCAWAAGELRVCADPNNLPFSSRQQQGFENELAQLIARDLGRTVRYRWWPQRRGFVRNTLDAGECDVIMGVPADDRQVLTTRPYYRSTYVFVSRHDRHLRLRSLDDPQLRLLRIGVHTEVPPAQVLAARQLQSQVRSYSLYGDYLRPDPPRRLIDAVARGAVDVGIAWGPLAGYFAAREPGRLELAPVPPVADLPFLPMSFAISMGVRRNDAALRAVLDREIGRRRTDIQQLLVRYGVPLLPLM